jgi:hypothetical protein
MTGGRERLVELARAKPIPPYSLDEELTFFCPRENLAGLGLPAVRAFHRWLLHEYRPPAGDDPAVLLLLPGQKVKPCTLSDEHRAVNGVLLADGFRPLARGDWPEPLAGFAAPELLANAPLAGHGLRIDRAVVSEPFGLVPYEAVYHWRGRPSPCARYDDPGLFEHRGLACTWRADCTVVRSGGAWRWGDAEREAFVEVHNRLGALLAAVLQRWRDRYVAVLAYVAPRLTHRSFLCDAAERRAVGLPTGRRVAGRLLPLRGVGELAPGLVTLVPDGRELAVLRRDQGGHLPADLLTRAWCQRLLLDRLHQAARSTASLPR